MMFSCDWCIADPTHVIGLFPEFLPSEFRKQLEYPAPPPQLTAGELEKGCLALVEYLTQVMQIHISLLGTGLQGLKKVLSGHPVQLDSPSGQVHVTFHSHLPIMGIRQVIYELDH